MIFFKSFKTLPVQWFLPHSSNRNWCHHGTCKNLCLLHDGTCNQPYQWFLLLMAIFDSFDPKQPAIPDKIPSLPMVLFIDLVQNLSRFLQKYKKQKKRISPSCWEINKAKILNHKKSYWTHLFTIQSFICLPSQYLKKWEK